MALYTIADLHLPLGVDKPMDIFGNRWENYIEKLSDNWQSNVTDNDVVVIAGDFSWATYLEESFKDFKFLNNLNGKKIILKGNHDYWWTTKNKLQKFISENGFKNIEFLHNNSYMYNDIAICGTRGWMHPEWTNITSKDTKIFKREVLRLEFSINTAKDYKDIFVFTHYPPMSDKLEKNEFSDVLERYNVSKCLYGHLHSYSHKYAINSTVRGVEYKLISGDYIDFMPVKLAD